MNKTNNSSLLTKIKTQISSASNRLCFLSGFFLIFAYAPWSYWWLTLVLPSIALYQIQQLSPKRAALKLGIFAFGWFSSGISWVHVSIDQFGGLPLIVSLLLMLSLCVYLSIFPTLAGYLAARLSTNKQLNLWLLPSAWLLCEYLRAIVLTGFPWLSLGYSQIDGPLASFAPIIGEVGITAVVLVINICLVKIYPTIRLKFTKHSGGSTLLKSPNVAQLNAKSLIVPITLIVGTLIGGFTLSSVNWVELTGKSSRFALIQGNIAQSMKWQPDQEWPTMLKYLDLTRVNYDADIIVWPESAIPSLEPAVQDYLDTVNRSAILNDSAIITGLINYNYQSNDYFNGLIVLGKKTQDDNVGYYYDHPNRYYKSHLLPIGEFVPFEDLLRPLAPFFNLPMSSFTAGDYVQSNLIAKDISILPLNCFEVAFPLQLAANFTRETQMILTVSNDAWFGHSHGPHQHFEIARMRALEFGRPLVRATNNGLTGIINHKGQVTAIAPQFEEAVLKGEVSFVSGFTPYSQWPKLLLALMILIPIIVIKVLTAKRN